MGGDEKGIFQAIDMTYKGGESQIGGMLIGTYFEDDIFEQKCKEWGIDFFRYPLCAYCGKVIYGSATYGKKGAKCFECEMFE